jgi:hypothetical protein
MENLARYLRISEQLPGWIRGDEAEALALVSFSLPGSPIIMQIGTFFGSAAVLLAGARKLRGSGMVHCVDPFDCSGDDFSVPHYNRFLAASGGGQLRVHFERNMRYAKLEDWIEVHECRAEELALGWSIAIDMLALGGDQSPAGARAAYESWLPFLKPGGTIAIHNSSPREYAPTHDGNRRIVAEDIIPPYYTDIRLVEHTTLARRASALAHAADVRDSLAAALAERDVALSQAAELRGSLAAARADLRGIAAQRDAAIAEVTALRSSTSWAVTTPLRILSSLIRQRPRI